jgi:hypothetical protein
MIVKPLIGVWIWAISASMRRRCFWRNAWGTSWGGSGFFGHGIGDNPTASMPGACCGSAETQGGYRLLSQDGFDWLDMLEPHSECTRERMAAHPVVLCVQDTTQPPGRQRERTLAGRLRTGGRAGR